MKTNLYTSGEASDLVYIFSQFIWFARYEAPLKVVRVPPITFTRMFEPRHNILSKVHAVIRKYVVSWFKRSRESNGPVPGPFAENTLMGAW